VLCLSQVELSRVAGSFPQDRVCEAASESSGDSGREEDETAQGSGQVTVRVRIHTQCNLCALKRMSKLLDTLAEARAALL